MDSIKGIFVAARRLTDPDDRRAYLDEACGEHVNLRKKVDGLLAAVDQEHANPLDDAVEQLGHAQAAAGIPKKEQSTAGESLEISSHPMIGPYKLLEQLGEGGMGTVYMAQQQSPVKRKVALKLVKPGMDSKEVIARFEAERQALAMMDHSNIARIFDGGLTEQGRPYFVMELVRGLPIDKYCDEATLSLRDRLKLFIDVCRAVQHAHQKGIIHRDLKPSNILVTLHDGVPVVKVIDFGIAKALDNELTERTLFTQYSQLIGTPLYMSPEQQRREGN
ncbi:MAG: serine/threonine protein kinase [Fuerstiella sp.]|nr:serine/threonine protein kinase [Fuerstiella sp.]